MRILDQVKGERLDRITLYLTMAEAVELKQDLQALIDKPRHNHAHIVTDDLEKEVAICIYDASTVEDFDPRSRKLILEDI